MEFQGTSFSAALNGILSMIWSSGSLTRMGVGVHYPTHQQSAPRFHPSVDIFLSENDLFRAIIIFVASMKTINSRGRRNRRHNWLHSCKLTFNIIKFCHENFPYNFQFFFLLRKSVYSDMIFQYREVVRGGKCIKVTISEGICGELQGESETESTETTPICFFSPSSRNSREQKGLHFSLSLPLKLRRRCFAERSPLDSNGN